MGLFFKNNLIKALHSYETVAVIMTVAKHVKFVIVFFLYLDLFENNKNKKLAAVLVKWEEPCDPNDVVSNTYPPAMYQWIFLFHVQPLHLANNAICYVKGRWQSHHRIQEY